MSTKLPAKINRGKILSLLLMGSFFMPITVLGQGFHRPKSSFQYGVEGFGTIGGVLSDSNDLAFKRNVLQDKVVTKDTPQILTDSQIGIQFSAEYQSKITGTVQFLAKERTDSFDDLLNLAYLQMNVTPRLSIRAGRLPLDICLLSENRNVGYSYLWSRPVPEFYGQFFLDSFNGFDVAYKIQTRIGFFELRGATGRFDIIVPYDEGEDLDTHLRSFFNVNARYQRKFWESRFSYMQATFDETSGDFDTFIQFAKVLPPVYRAKLNRYFEEFYLFEGSRIEHFSYSLGYNDNHLVLQSEIGRLQFERAMGLTFDSAYLSAGYRMGNLTPFGVLAWLHSSTDKPPQSGNFIHAPAEVQGIIQYLNETNNSLQAKQTTASLGVRWDFLDNVAMKAQWNHHWVSGKGSYLWDKNLSEPKTTEINTFSLSLDFIF